MITTADGVLLSDLDSARRNQERQRRDAVATAFSRSCAAHGIDARVLSPTDYARLKRQFMSALVGANETYRRER